MDVFSAHRHTFRGQGGNSWPGKHLVLHCKFEIVTLEEIMAVFLLKLTEKLLLAILYLNIYFCKVTEPSQVFD